MSCFLNENENNATSAGRQAVSHVNQTSSYSLYRTANSTMFERFKANNETWTCGNARQQGSTRKKKDRPRRCKKKENFAGILVRWFGCLADQLTGCLPGFGCRKKKFNYFVCLLLLLLLLVVLVVLVLKLVGCNTKHKVCATAFWPRQF